MTPPVGVSYTRSPDERLARWKITAEAVHLAMIARETGGLTNEPDGPFFQGPEYDAEWDRQHGK